MAIIAIIALALTACPPEPDNHTHEYGTAWKSNAAEHWHECTANDGAKIDVAAHTAGDWIVDQAATATTAGSQHKECTVCGYVIETETIPITHTHEWEWKVTTPATPTADGLETETCKTCGATNGTRPIAMLPRDQTATIALEFGANNYTATVKGYFSNTEWDGVPEKVETALEGAYTAGNPAVKTNFRNVFGVPNNTVNIIVEKMTEEGRTYKVDGTKLDDVIQLRLNFDALDNDDLQTKITSAIRYMNGDDGYSSEG